MSGITSRSASSLPRRLTLYLDGVQVAQATASAVSSGNSLPLNIGRAGPTNGNYWRGKLDEIRLWSVLRSSSDIQSAYRLDLSAAPTGLVGNWQFNEGSGSVAADGAGSPQNATLYGAVWSSDSPAPTPTASLPSPTAT